MLRRQLQREMLAAMKEMVALLRQAQPGSVGVEGGLAEPALGSRHQRRGPVGLSQSVDVEIGGYHVARGHSIAAVPDAYAPVDAEDGGRRRGGGWQDAGVVELVPSEPVADGVRRAAVSASGRSMTGPVTPRAIPASRFAAGVGAADEPRCAMRAMMPQPTQRGSDFGHITGGVSDPGVARCVRCD